MRDEIGDWTNEGRKSCFWERITDGDGCLVKRVFLYVGESLEEMGVGNRDGNEDEALDIDTGKAVKCGFGFLE